MNPSSCLKVRPQSAKYTFSSGKRNTSMRSQVREDSKLMHTQISSSKPLYSMTKLNAPELRRLLPKRVDISPERLFQQNMVLKKKINELTSEVKLERTKGETADKRNAKWKKRLDIEFEKEMYWGQKGEYMVMGVKNQYDKIKKMYEDKCKENQEIRRDLKYTQIQEVRAELDIYKQEVARLKAELDKFIEIYKVPYDVKGDDEVSIKLLISDQRENIERLEYEISTYRSAIKSMDKLVKDRDEKIEFLEKLVVDKDNYSHQMELTSKRLQHQNENIKAKNKELKQQMEREKDSINKRIEEIKNTEERRLEREISIFENEIHVKNQKITKLEAQIVYLSTLLAQWRPSQNDSLRNSIDHHKVHQEIKPVTMPKKQSDLAISIHEPEDLIKSKEINQLNKSSIEPHPLTQSLLNKKQKVTHYTLKREKVKKDQIQNICLEIKFRLLNKKIDFETAKGYIRATEGDEITIKELLEIFSQQPFCMQSPERRILLARYLIEDVQESKVYYDEERSASEVIVRSIFEQIIPKFSIPSQNRLSAIRAKVIEMLSKYHITLGQVVSQHNKQMILNQNKFIELLDEQELNMGQEYNDFMISHMLKSSPDITQLNFKALLTLVPPKDN